MFGNNEGNGFGKMGDNLNKESNFSFLRSDGNDKNNTRGRGPNKYNGNGSDSRNNRPISARLGSSHRLGGRGGGRIKKFGNDRDGDLSMNDPRKRRMNPYPNGRNNLKKNFHSINAEIVIASNVVGKVQDLEKLIKQKSKKPIKILKAEQNQNNDSIVKFFVEHMGHARALQKLSGIRFNGNTVTFSIKNNKNGSISDIKDSISIIESLKVLIRKRYNAESQYLNLDSLNEDPIFSEKKGLMNLNESENLGKVICKLIKENFPEVKTISFANNNLKTLRPFSRLYTWLPNILNLSFRNNKLTTLRDIEAINGDKFEQLRELVILENPIKERELQKYGNYDNLKSKIKAMFPTLRILDQEELPEGISFDVGKNLNSKTLPIQIKSSFIDSEVTANTLQDFIIKYFTLFDSNRVGLLDLYDDNAIFSLSVNHNHPQWRKRYEKGDNMSAWKAFDRNFKNTKPSSRDQLLIKNKNSIIQTIAKLPLTKHPLDDDSKMIIDSWQITTSPQQVLLFLNISGEFNEVEIKLRKSFSRTFLIAPSLPQSNAAKAGWPYTIYNDQMTVRPWSGNKSFDKAEPNAIQLNISSSAKAIKNNTNQNAFSTVPSTNNEIVNNNNLSSIPNQNQAIFELTPQQLQEQEQLRIQHGLNDMQHQEVLELSRQTRLTYLYSLQCLNDFSWNFSLALEGYQRVKDQVPPDGYYH